ncbi:facilitated trehalose transporter Tret1-like isoform X2 [Daktulosphaira vitifoliae]|uniref:facilitated trehalose transporter Tret1-like isoform X2 n=1 Tax=Daktulosphaira vitifoliae TaxID=58002 RepID=UPI0021AA89BC|nr:facilitated trehalose transporter Tret1-like isoform X2 [Daktulosphaira vitifoliae]
MEKSTYIKTPSLPNLMCPVGSLITGILADKIGRRKALQTSFIPMIASWAILGFYDSYNSIIIARMLVGYTEGTGGYVILYIAETSPILYRPLYFGVVIMLVGFGMLTLSILAIFFTWNDLSKIFCVITIGGALLLFLVPETPLWLRSRGRYSEAKRVEEWFGGDPKLMPNSVEVTETLCSQKPLELKWSIYTSRPVWMPALISLIFFVCQQGTGFFVLLFYSIDVVKDCHVSVDPLSFAAYLSITRIIGSIVYTLQYETKRRTLVVISSLGMFVGLLSIISYMYIFEDVVRPPFEFIPVAGFLVYVFFGLLGMLSLPFSICGELFPMSVKGTMTGVMHSLGYELVFLATKVYPFLVLTLGIKLVWTIFAGFCLLSALYGAFILPETKGKSLDEILKKFKSKNKNENFL